MAIPTRAELLGALADREFDVLVIGGGITGCGIARDATLRGLSVALVEKDDFASGTSSRSSRLVHGGVRYLENGQLHLVFEASAERHRLLELAPHLVRPLPFTWPVYRGSRIPRWKLLAGLTLYDGLALFRNVRSHQRLSSDAVRAAEPAVRSTGLLGGARYYDATTDDARLTLANAIGAIESGAIVVNHTALRRLTASSSGHVATVFDSVGGATIDIRARIIVNAAGPWSDEVLHLEAPLTRSIVHGSKGVHIAVARDRVANHDAITLLSPLDGRVMFVLPAGALAIIGTTDSYTSQSPDNIRATEEDVAYLLGAANFLLPDANLGRDDVVAAWAGIRPLASRAGNTSSVRASREHAITETADGVVSITGGKLTTYRVMAADVVDVVIRRLGYRSHRSPTRNLALPGGDLVSVTFAESEASKAIGNGATARHLVANYGSNWRMAWASMQRRPDGTVPIDEAFPYSLGEMRWAVEQEMACTLGDLLVRRTRLAFETRDHGRAAAVNVAQAVGPLLSWDDARIHNELAAYDREVARLFAIEPESSAVP